ncbi:MAG TPA: lipid-A-disaccharide synthase [Acidobacteriota bacterium]|nr:lipid-A-disaccharide synthase [Acidobacteriota bacterium]
MVSFCIVAGEPSGDLHGALLAQAVRERRPDWELWGVGSDRMAAAGCDLWEDARDWSVMGFSGVLRSAGAFRRRLNGLAAEIGRRQPRAVILIDYPGFNLRLASRVKRQGIDVYYYIVPQVWAWGRGRLKAFRRYVDRSIVVFPFERDFFEANGVTTEWVGHPLIDLVKPSAPRPALRDRFGVAADEILITMLPGARRQDFDIHLPVFTEAIAGLRGKIPGVRAALGLAPVLADMAGHFAGHRAELIVSSDVYDLVAASDLVLTKTGTTTIECALLGTPMVTGYRMNTVNYLIARSLIRVPYIAMPNLIAGRSVVPELVQRDLTSERVATEAYRLIVDQDARREQLRGLTEVRVALGGPGAPGRAADLICRWAESSGN